MLRLIAILFWLTVGALAVIFTAPNLHPVQLNYYLSTTQLPLAVVVLISLWLGALLGVFFTYHQVLALRRDNRRLRKIEQARATAQIPAAPESSHGQKG